MSYDSSTFIEKCTPRFTSGKEYGGATFFFAYGITGSDRSVRIEGLTREQHSAVELLVQRATEETARNVQRRARQALGIEP